MRERIQRVMAETFRVSPDTIGGDASIETVPGWDSLHHLELMLALEIEFGVRISTDTMMELLTLPAIEEFVTQEGRAKSG